MNKVNGYGLYNNYRQNNVNQKKNAVKNGRTGKKHKTDKTDKTDKTGKNTNVQLSESAKKLLEQLKKMYTNMDFMVADYETEEEAQEYLSRGTKEYSVLIDPETLEEMAADEDVKNKYLGVLEEATAKFSDMQEKLGDNKDEVVRLGVSIDNNGNVSYFAELEKMGEAQRERIEKAKEEKQEEKAEEKKAADRERRRQPDRAGRRDDRFIQEGTKRTRVQSDSIEGLLSEIQNVDWSRIKGDGGMANGDRFDLSI